MSDTDGDWTASSSQQSHDSVSGSDYGREHHPHWCASCDRHLENLTEDGRIIAVLEFMKRAGFHTLSVFLRMFFSSDGDPVKRRAGKFFQHGGFGTCVSAMLQHKRFGPSRRATNGATMSFREELGEEVGDLLLRIMEAELDELGKDPSLRLNPDSVKASDIEEFSFAKYMDQYHTSAPTLTWLIKRLCRVAEGNSDEQSGEAILLAKDEESEVAESSMEEQEEVDISSDDDDETLKFGVPYQPIVFDIPKQVPLQKRRRRKKNTFPLATTIIAQILYARNHSVNRLQVC
jgi:hypothetical protein